MNRLVKTALLASVLLGVGGCSPTTCPSPVKAPQEQSYTSVQIGWTADYVLQPNHLYKRVVTWHIIDIYQGIVCNVNSGRCVTQPPAEIEGNSPKEVLAKWIKTQKDLTGGSK